ncbi:NAD(P)H-dependent oxidoreductase [Herbaspirillum rhizosphaerae]|uniref:NAD(P)H-dependent oxidoreductase n=1 Tax=Herbaspirillum rhizosphaerae TaxID=346179 RepID=A0ABW8Z8H5_9BURK
MTTSRILILYAHPGGEHSYTNRTMIEAARSLPQVRVHDLYECYPDFHIDVEYEQAQLHEADLVVLHHPIHWYSMPALQKEWIDLVLQRGWAFGPGGDALHGKDFWLVATTGGDADAYQAGGRHGHPFSDFLPPYQQTARLCGMRWQTPNILHGAHHLSKEALIMHAANYRARLDSYPDWPATETSTSTP